MKTRNQMTRIATATATAITIASLVLPFKAKAEEPKTIAQFFYQTGKGRSHEAGFGLDSAFGLGRLSLNLGAGIAGNLETGATALESASAAASIPLFWRVSATAYGQRSRFLGDQKAVGGALHLPLDPATLHIGTERDFSGTIPIFAGADFAIGPLVISPTAIAPFVPNQDTPNLGGALKISWKTRFASFFARFFGMSNPKEGKALAGNLQIGVDLVQ